MGGEDAGGVYDQKSRWRERRVRTLFFPTLLATVIRHPHGGREDVGRSVHRPVELSETVHQQHCRKFTSRWPFDPLRVTRWQHLCILQRRNHSRNPQVLILARFPFETTYKQTLLLRQQTSTHSQLPIIDTNHNLQFQCKQLRLVPANPITSRQTVISERIGASQSTPTNFAFLLTRSSQKPNTTLLSTFTTSTDAAKRKIRRGRRRSVKLRDKTTSIHTIKAAHHPSSTEASFRSCSRSHAHFLLSLFLAFDPYGLVTVSEPFSWL